MNTHKTNPGADETNETHRDRHSVPGMEWPVLPSRSDAYFESGERRMKRFLFFLNDGLSKNGSGFSYIPLIVLIQVKYVVSRGKITRPEYSQTLYFLHRLLTAQH